MRKAQNERIHQTFAARAKDPAANAAWEEACHVWHGTRLPADYLWSGEFGQRVRSGDREAVKDAVLFLEVDPWYFRSGYLKERLIDGLKRAPLTEHDRERLRQVILNVAHGRNRREFRYYCRLAAVVENAEFRRALEREAEKGGPSALGKLAYLLSYLRQHSKLQTGGDVNA